MPKPDAGVTDSSAAMMQAIDRYLAEALAAVRDDRALPPWPAFNPQADAVCARIAFHGIALALLRDPGKLSGWPAAVRGAIGEAARGQSFWEIGHRETATRLIDALALAGEGAIITKGTALAYSVYPEPAMRRRGDSDVLLGEVPRQPLRDVLLASGFHAIGDARPLQESWAARCSLGFTHVFDLHWRINASALLAQRLEAAGIGARSVPLPRLAQNAQAIAPAHNLILVAVNRASHETFGYRSGDDKLFDQDRLIWALDIDLITKAYCAQDWLDLLAAAAASGTGPVVRSALGFAEATLGTAIPADFASKLAALPGDPGLLRYFGAMSGIDRLRCDLAASPTLGAKLRLTLYTLFPGSEVLHERFPGLTHWPLAALQVRRLGSGLGKLLRRRG